MPGVVWGNRRVLRAVPLSMQQLCSGAVAGGFVLLEGHLLLGSLETPFTSLRLVLLQYGLAQGF